MSRKRRKFDAAIKNRSRSLRIVLSITVIFVGRECRSIWAGGVRIGQRLPGTV